MVFTKKINFKLAVIATSFMMSLIITNSLLMDYGLNKSIELTYSTHYKEAKKVINNEAEILKGIGTSLAENLNLIDVLKNNKNVDDLDDIDKQRVFSEIDTLKDYLSGLIFVNSLSIVSIEGEYLFHDDKVIKNYNLLSREFMEGVECSKNNSQIVTNMYKDYETGKYTLSLINFIYTDESNKPLGAAILDVFFEDIIKSMNSTFYMGELNTYIKLSDTEYYSIEGVIRKIDNKKNNYIVSLDNILGTELDIVLEFDRDSIIYNKEMKEINNFRIIAFAILGIIYLIVLTILLRATFKPILVSVDKLKVLFKNLENNTLDFDKIDEFKQLEIISGALRTSFDRKIQSLIYYDELTKLPNRKLLFAICEDLISSNTQFALIFIDLNKFKFINDVFGHTAGDEMLANFSKRMQNCLGNHGILTRYSGDEFIVIFNKYYNNKSLELFYENVILEEFKNPIVFNSGKKMLIEFSAGVAVYPRDADNFDDLIDKSDFMMYSSKKSENSKKLLFFNNEIYKNIIRVENIKSDLKNAVDNNEFILYYQPIVDKNKKINKFEALIRWNNKKLGLILPVDFIKYAEETGEIVKIGYWIIEEVCKSFDKLIKYSDSLKVSINVSPIQLMEVDFFEKTEKILNKYNVSWEKLCFEITESVVLDEHITINNNLLLLSKKGVKIALDDFGTGYASFSYLKKFKLDILKIDKIFIDNGSYVDFKIVSNIKNIAHLLQMETIIEGVETEIQFNMLSDIGCDYFQGYYFSRPFPANEVEKVLQVESECAIDIYN